MGCPMKHGANIIPRFLCSSIHHALQLFLQVIGNIVIVVTRTETVFVSIISIRISNSRSKILYVFNQLHVTGIVYIQGEAGSLSTPGNLLLNQWAEYPGCQCRWNAVADNYLGCPLRVLFFLSPLGICSCCYRIRRQGIAVRQPGQPGLNARSNLLDPAPRKKDPQYIIGVCQNCEHGFIGSCGIDLVMNSRASHQYRLWDVFWIYSSLMFFK